MNRSRRHAVAIALGLLLLAPACSSENTSTAPGGSGDTGSTSSVPGESTTSTSSTVAAESTTTTPAESTTTAAPAPTSAPPATPAPTVAPPAGGAVLGAPTNLRAVSTASVVLWDDFTCEEGDPGIPGWTVDDCQQMPSYEAGVTTLIAHRNDNGQLAVFVLFHEEGSLVSMFEAVEPDAGVWESVTVVLGDFHFDDGAEVWVGYRYAGTGGYLDLDVLDPRPNPPDFPATRDFFLGGIQGLDHGQVEMHPGGATVLTAVYADADPNCCPSSFMVREITWASGDWRINAGTTYPAASAPSVVSDF